MGCSLLFLIPSAIPAKPELVWVMDLHTQSVLDIPSRSSPLHFDLGAWPAWITSWAPMSLGFQSGLDNGEPLQKIRGQDKSKVKILFPLPPPCRLAKIIRLETKPSAHSLSVPMVHLSLCMLSQFSHVRLFGTPGTIAHQAPLSMRFSRQEYWSVLPCPPPGDLPHSGIKSASHVSWIGRRVLYH